MTASHRRAFFIGYAAIVATAAAYLIWSGVQRTGWYRVQLYEQLIREVEPAQRTELAQRLARFGGETELLQVLSLPRPELHAVARYGLEFIWASAAGLEPMEAIEQAVALAARKEHDDAILQLNEVIARHPRYAEA